MNRAVVTSRPLALACLAAAILVLRAPLALAGDRLLDAPLFSAGAGTSISAVALADIDGDGDLDAVATLETDDQVVVLLGAGDGSFGAPGTPVTVGDEPVDVSVAKLNGDAHLDLAVANQDSFDVSILLGVGDGTFTAATSVVTSFAPVRVIAADVDGNGDTDLVLGLAGRVAVRLGAGDGTFGPADEYVEGTPLGMVVADVTGDDILDVSLATTTDDDTLRILPGVGDGTFGTATVLPLVGFLAPRDVAVADFTDDGIVDVAVLERAPGVIELFAGLGGGAFAAGVTSAVPDHGFDPRMIAEDMDGDGVPDLVLTVGLYDFVGGGPDLSIARHTSGGSFAVETRSLPTGGPMAIGDIDGDRDADLVHAGGHVTGSYVGVAYNRGDGTLKAPTRESHVGIPRQAAVADLDGDGLGDVVGVHYTGPITSGASVFLSEGGGDFGPPSLNLTTPGDFPNSVAVTDLDDDGALDLLMGLGNGGDLVAMLGVGDGTFGAPVATSTADIPFDVAVDFLDGDAFPDVVVTHTSTDEAQSWLGDGDGTFTLADTEPLTGTVEWARIADLDDNGDADIVVSVGNGDLALLTGAGDGTFIRTTNLDGAPGNQMNGVVVDSFNADSLPDIAVFTDGAAWVHLGVGAGLFAPRVSYQHRGIDAGTPTSADLDGDGAVDLVFSRGNELHVMPGAGDGTFGAPLTFQLTHWVLFPDGKPPAFGDVDGDGSLDLARSDGSSVDGGISILLNRSGPAADLGFGLGGTHGVPVLEAAGTFASGASVSFALTNARENDIAHLVLGALRLDAPFKFGVLVPFPHFIIFNLPTDGNGELVIPMTWPTGLPAGVMTYWQYWLPDPAGIVGFAASTALEITTP